MSPLTLLINLLLFLGSLRPFIHIIYASYSRPKDPKNHKKPPLGPPPLPIIGNLHKLGNHPHRYLQTLAKQYGPIMLLWLGKTPTIMVSSPEAAEQVELMTLFLQVDLHPKSLISPYMVQKRAWLLLRMVHFGVTLGKYTHYNFLVRQKLSHLHL